MSPTGSGSVSGGGTYDQGSTCTLTATPATGYRFVRWNDNVTTAARSFTVTTAATYTAYFERITYGITRNLTNCSLSNAATTVNHGSAYTSNVTADSGYVLSSVTVTMGGVDITSSAYSDGVINVASVTGAISITATSITARLPDFAAVSFTPNPARSGQGVVVQVTMETV